MKSWLGILEEVIMKKTNKKKPKKMIVGRKPIKIKEITSKELDLYILKGIE